MLQPAKIAADDVSHEDIFLARYTRLRAWALQLADHNRERAEDLVQDAFIHFTFTRPDLNAIQNLDGYLYSMLRNLHLSQVRRSLRLPSRSLSIVDYDSAEIGLRATDPRDQIRIQDELRQVCHYACLRKETSKAGSVLILRFMHGYYPREIAQVMRSTRPAVEERLRNARSEAKQYLLNPKSLRFMRETPTPTATACGSGLARATDDLLHDLRHTVFQSCQGSCFTSEHLESLYQQESTAGVDGATLAHLVSCARCLDEVNELFGLPPLSERYPMDTLGTDTPAKGGGDDGDSGGGTGAGSEKEFQRRCRRRARDVFEHRPQELCISVNGYLLAAQKTGAEFCEQTLSINLTEQINFIEVTSEQEVRLLFLDLNELLPGESGERSAGVKLSDDRTLEATLSFHQPWPVVQVVYRDPLLRAESTAPLYMAEEKVALHEATRRATSQEEEHHEAATRPGRGRTLLGTLARLWRWFAHPGFWLRPGTVTAGVAMILIAALLLMRVHVPVVSAAELLRRSAAAEEITAGNPGLVLHRTINLEERKERGGALIARRRIEVWQSAAQGLNLRRVYDDQNILVAGEWTKADGTSTIYRRSLEPQDHNAPEVETRTLLETGDLWRLDPSAKDFSALVGCAEGMTVEEKASAYLISYQVQQAGGAVQGLVKATLTLNKDDLHAVEQTLFVQRGGETRVYRFTESGLAQHPKDTVAPSIFQPEPELLGSSGKTKSESEKIKAQDDPGHPSSLIPHPSAAVASPELEIEVTYLLNQIKANLGEQVSMTRTAGGALRVEALVETQQRKEEILRALNPVIRNPAVIVEVSTVAEAMKRQPGPSKGRAATVRDVEVTTGRIPADAELRRYFSARSVDSNRIDEEITQYANRMMSRSRQAVLHASALKRLARRFSPEETRTLAPEARAKWLKMIREHALAYQRETGSLRQELHVVFAGAATGGVTNEAVSEANLVQAAERLLQLSYAQDEAVRSAFTISEDGRTAAAIKAPQFWRSLRTAEELAAAIQSVYQK